METIILYVMIAFISLCLFLVLRNDLPRWQRMNRDVEAEVTGHRSMWDDGAKSYAPIYGFSAEGKRHEVIDQLYSGREYPAIGTRVTLRYPVGRPDLARIPRPATWLAVYAALLFALAIPIAKLAGWLD